MNGRYAILFQVLAGQLAVSGLFVHYNSGYVEAIGMYWLYMLGVILISGGIFSLLLAILDLRRRS